MGRFVGTSIASLKKKPELIPVWACIIAGMGLAAAYTLRLATKSPEVSWKKAANKEPWQEYETKSYKFMNPAGSKVGNDHPKF